RMREHRNFIAARFDRARAALTRANRLSGLLERLQPPSRGPENQQCADRRAGNEQTDRQDAEPRTEVAQNGGERRRFAGHTDNPEDLITDGNRGEDKSATLRTARSATSIAAAI